MMKKSAQELEAEMAKALHLPEPKRLDFDNGNVPGFETLKEWLEKDFGELLPWQRQIVEQYLSFGPKSNHDGDTAMDITVPKKNAMPYDIVKKMAEIEAEEQRTATMFPADPTKPAVQIKQDFMRYDPHGSKGGGVYCTCGAYKIHARGKVLARWADKHFDKTGHKYKRS